MDDKKLGHVLWVDLTIPNAEEIRDFYAAVVGWRPQAVDMGEYADFNMLTPGADQPVAGIVHARGQNADLPPQWLIYVLVEDVRASVAACLARGGRVLAGPHEMAPGQHFCVIADPNGAACALMEPAP